MSGREENPTSDGGVQKPGFHVGFHIERWMDALINIVLWKVNGDNRDFGRRLNG